MTICKCKRVIAALMRLGANHAARMHYLMAMGQSPKWSPRDWELHFREEEKLLFPILIARGHRALAERLAREHATFRGQLRQFGEITSDALMNAHSEFEDEMVLSLGI